MVFYNGGAIKYQRGFLQRKKNGREDGKNGKRQENARKCRICVLDRPLTFTKRVSILGNWTDISEM